jgi:hypothetical protein
MSISAIGGTGENCQSRFLTIPKDTETVLHHSRHVAQDISTQVRSPYFNMAADFHVSLPFENHPQTTADVRHQLSLRVCQQARVPWESHDNALRMQMTHHWE